MSRQPPGYGQGRKYSYGHGGANGNGNGNGNGTSSVQLSSICMLGVYERLAKESPKSLWILYRSGSKERRALAAGTTEMQQLWATAYRSLMQTVSLLFPPPDFVKVLARRHFQLAFFAALAKSALDAQELGFALLIAITGNRPSLCRKLLDAGAALQLTDSWHPDPLHLAAEYGCSTMCVMIVHSGDDVNRVHRKYGRAIDRAVYGRQFATCQVLLKLGSTKKSDPPPSLIDCIVYNDLDLLTWFLDKGADPNAPDVPGGDTPLYVAALGGNEEICKRLVTAGASLMGVPSTAGTKNKESSQGVSASASTSTAVSASSSPLFAAIGAGHTGAFRALLAMGKSYGVLHALAPALFMEACRRGQRDMLLLLRAAGSFKGVDTQALLFAAIDAGHADVCSALFDDIDFELLDEASGHTPLHRAAWARSSACCQVLVAAGANVNAENKGKDTPLHIAVESGCLDVCETLVMLGADVNAHNRSGETPMHYAAMHGFTDIAMFLADNGASAYALNGDGQSPLHLAVEAGSYAMCQCLLVDIGIDPNAANKSGETPLHLAVIFANHDICELLIENGALVNAINQDGSTPLDFAKSDPDSPLREFLISRGAFASARLGQIVYSMRLRRLLGS